MEQAAACPKSPMSAGRDLAGEDIVDGVADQAPEGGAVERQRRPEPAAAQPADNRRRGPRRDLNDSGPAIEQDPAIRQEATIVKA